MNVRWRSYGARGAVTEVAAVSDKQAAVLREYLENREMPATVYAAICVAIRKLEEPMDGGAGDG